MIALLIILINFFLSIAVANWASNKGRDFWNVFFLCLFLSPLCMIGFLWNPVKYKSSFVK
jgi:hypothetical protein